MANQWNINGMLPWLVAALLLGLLGSSVLGDNYNVRDYNHNNNNNNRMRPGSYCEDLSPQQFIAMDHIMGMWYGAEVITHQDGVEMEQIYDTCVIIHLSEATDDVATTEMYRPRQDQGYHNRDHHNRHRNQLRYLRLIWDEKGTTLEYLLKYNDNRTGYWMSAGPQHGKMAELAYKQFTGTIQVIKAVGNHLVLTFCQTTPNNQMFSIILSRQVNVLTYDEILRIKKLFNYRQLPISSVRKVCLHGAAASLYNARTGFLILATALYFALRSATSK